MNAEALPFAVKMEREVSVMRLLQRDRKKIDPRFIEKWGKTISDVIEDNPLVSQPEELVHMMQMRAANFAQ